MLYVKGRLLVERVGNGSQFATGMISQRSRGVQRIGEASEIARSEHLKSHYVACTQAIRLPITGEYLYPKILMTFGVRNFP